MSRSGDREQRGDGVSLFVRNIGNDTRAEVLREAFSEYGEVKDVYLPRDYYTRQPRGFAYVEFSNRQDADAAMDRLHGRKIEGRVVAVEYARGERKSRGEMRQRDRRRSYSRSRSPSGGRARRRRGRSRSFSRSPPRYARRSPPRRRYSRSPPRRSGRSRHRDSRSHSRSRGRRSRSRSRSRSMGGPGEIRS